MVNVRSDGCRSLRLHVRADFNDEDREQYRGNEGGELRTMRLLVVVVERSMMVVCSMRHLIGVVRFRGMVWYLAFERWKRNLRGGLRLI